MAPVLYGSVGYICTNRVLLAAAELGEELEFVHVDTMKGEHKTAEYLKIHPWGRIPTLKNGDFTMYESRAISRYLACSVFPEKGKSLVPSPDVDPEAFALFEQAASVEMAYINPFLEGLVTEKYFVPAFGGKLNPVKIAEQRKNLDDNLKVLDGILATRQYVAGNEFTLADVFYVPFIFMLGSKEVGEFDLITSRPNISAWWERITSRPAFKKVYSS
ncbi:glutathione S-transferase-like protein [Ilyonectria sp. MPI-CAGE-AT-0026]|nr:glutathione S-transferase-like protein [Ilyonectria sp. MPI-CAGE-AT-0026]